MQKIVLHIISSLNRGGRERQLAGILKFDYPEIKSKAFVFNNSENSYADEYNLTDQIIYLRSKSTFGRLIEIINIVKKERPDLLWSWGGFEATFGVLVSFLTAVKHINGSVRHGIVLNNHKHLWRKLILHMSRNVAGNSRAGLKANGIKNGDVLYNGLDEKFFDLSEKKSFELVLPNLKNKLNEEILTLISVANLVPFKDYSTILSSLAEINNAGYKFQYLIIGEGPERSDIEKKIEKYNLSDQVFLLGRRENVSDLLGLSDIFIHSSRGEGCSNAILEAMAAGLPVVATDTGGTNEIVKPSHGLLFEFKNSKQLSEQLKQLMDNPQIVKEMRIKAREYAMANFSMDRMMKDYHSIIQKVCNS